MEDVWSVWSVVWKMFGLSGASYGGCLVCLERRVEVVWSVRSVVWRMCHDLKLHLLIEKSPLISKYS